MKPLTKINGFPIEKIEPASPDGAGFAGFMFYHQSHLPSSLILDWDGDGYNFNLEGPKANRFFKIDAHHRSSGFLIRTPEFRVDLGSAFNPNSTGSPLGSLVLEGGVAYLVGARLDDHFADGEQIPLWASVPQPKCSTRVGFLRWTLVARVGDFELELWQY